MGVRRISIKDMTGLEPKHANFVIEYVKDFSPRRAAEQSGFSAEYGATLRDRPDIAAAVDQILLHRLEASNIDAEWLLMEAVDNHLIARQRGNLPASNTALNLIAKHVFVDAFAAEKVELSTDKDVVERLLRARARIKQANNPEEVGPVSFM